MKLHKEGTTSILIALILFIVICWVAWYVSGSQTGIVFWLVFVVALVFLLIVVAFFRVPNRKYTTQETAIVAPADGKVVVIEEMYDDEYFKDKRLQISIFMSPFNVHVNRNPVSGKVIYNQYHKGKYLVAWNPKSSTENERQSMVIENKYVTLLVKQIAGALAKRIVNYAKVGQQVTQSDEFGFIKFGSRVDVLLPVGTKVEVPLNQKVQGGVTVIATIQTTS